MEILPKRLKSLRKDKKITQKELAESLGMNRATYAMYESGNNQPKEETLKIIADFYGVSIDFLLGNELDKIDRIIQKTSELTLNKKIKWYGLRDENLPPEQIDYLNINDVFNYFNITNCDKLYSYLANHNRWVYLFLKTDKLYYFIVCLVYEDNISGLEINGFKVSSRERNLNNLLIAIKQSYQSAEDELFDKILDGLDDIENPLPDFGSSSIPF